MNPGGCKASYHQNQGVFGVKAATAHSTTQLDTHSRPMHPDSNKGRIQVANFQ